MGQGRSLSFKVLSMQAWSLTRIPRSWAKKKKKAILVISELGKQRQVALWGLLTQPAQLIQQITNPVSETNQTGF